MAKVCKDHLGNQYNSFTEMTKKYGIDSSVINTRLRKGWNLEKALTTPLQNKFVYDHLGNKFKNVKEMTQQYNISVRAFHSRLNKGWLLKDALTVPVYNKLIVYDHLGNKFKNVKEMCIFWHIPYNVYRSRKNNKWAIKKILTTPVDSTIPLCMDHLGNVFSSQRKMCEHYNISFSVYRNRIAAGYSLEEALTTPKGGIFFNREIKDHLGNIYPNYGSMCKAYDITYKVFKTRIDNGWTLEKALTYQELIVDHLGNTFKSKKELCAHYDINYNLFCERIQGGMSIEKALTLPYRNPCHDVEYNGKKYSSLKELAKSYDISYKALLGRLQWNWTLEEALTIPKHMYLGEYRVAQYLQSINVKYYYNCNLRVIFENFHISVSWQEFLLELKNTLESNNIHWSVAKIQRLRPDFVLYTDNDNNIKGVIEFDGEQHQNFVEFFFKTIEEFLRRSNVDFVKNTLWEYLHVPMLRIRYDQVNYIPQMIDDFLKNKEKYIERHNTYLTEEDYWKSLNETKLALQI